MRLASMAGYMPNFGSGFKSEKKCPIQSILIQIKVINKVPTLNLKKNLQKQNDNFKQQGGGNQHRNQCQKPQPQKRFKKKPHKRIKTKTKNPNTTPPIKENKKKYRINILIKKRIFSISVACFLSRNDFL